MLTWTAVLVLPGDAPTWLLVLLVVTTGLGGPGSMIGFDLARTSNPAKRLGTATGIVNVGGFVASLVTILLIGLILDARTGGRADYDIGDFKVAMSVQYLIGAIGVLGILRTRRLTRRRLAEEGVTIRPIREVLAEKGWFNTERSGKSAADRNVQKTKVPARRT
jgi:MFS family permease